MKVLLQEVNYKEIDVELPFFAYLQEEDKEIFIRIDEKTFKEIIFHISGFVEFIKFRSSGSIAECYYKNQTTEDHWNENLKSAKKFVSNF